VLGLTVFRKTMKQSVPSKFRGLTIDKFFAAKFRFLASARLSELICEGENSIARVSK
jgi:hypothetical protein